MDNKQTVSTVIIKSQQKPDDLVHIGLDLDYLEVSVAESKASYQEIKDYVLEHTGLKISTLYIAQIKAKHGIIERECYNKPKGSKTKSLKCPIEKRLAIEDALRHFRMIAT